MEINISSVPGNAISQLLEHYKEGRIGLLVVLTKILNILGYTGLCYFGYLILKLVIAILICKHPELSNEKVKYITRTIAKDNKHQSN